MKKPASKKMPVLAAPLPEKLPGEPERFYKRFLTFCLADGMARSIEAVWRKEQGSGKSQKKQSAPGSWYQAADAWQWRERAAEYDCAVLSAEAAELEATRKAERIRRRALVSAFVGGAEKLLADPLAFTAAPASVSAAILRAVEASRREFGADPLPEDWKSASQHKPNGQLEPPLLEIFLDGGDGKPGDLSTIGPPDNVSPDDLADAATEEEMLSLPEESGNLQK